MSATMHWKPTPADLKGKALPDKLRYILARRWLGQDGSLTAGPRTVTACDRGYLQGLADAGIDGAQQLSDAIVKHDSVDIWITK